MPNSRARTRQLGERHARLHESHLSRGEWEGDLVRIRMTALPPKAGLDGSMETIDFDDDEGLGEESAFLFHPATRTLVLQYNHFGVTPNLFARYFENIGNLEGMIELLPAIRPDMMERVADMDEYRVLEIGLAGLENSTALGNQGRSLSGLVDVINEFQAPAARITLSMSHQRGTLARQTLTRTIQWLRGSQQVTKIKVTGKDDDESRVIDLLHYRLVEKDDIELDEHRRMPYASRRAAVHNAWNRHRNGITQLFGGE